MVRDVGRHGPDHAQVVRVLADVRLWHAAPDRNFGWIVLGDETAMQTAKSFASREADDPERSPLVLLAGREECAIAAEGEAMVRISSSGVG